jgi:DUF438 domain-containing protein
MMVEFNKTTLSAEDRVAAWIEEFPFLADTLTDLSPRYAALKNPVMRKTLGKVATWRMAASMGGVPLTDLLLAVADAVRERVGIECTLDSGKTDDSADRDRLERLKGLILSLHAGVDLAEAKKTFEEQFGDVAAHEIAKMEQELISQGLPVEDVKALCDVHVGLFKDGLSGNSPESKPGHPVQSMLEENEQLQNRIEGLRTILERGGDSFAPESHPDLWEAVGRVLKDLREIEKHYLRKENLLFPRLENHEFSGPSQVMWAVHDDIRADLREAISAHEDGNAVRLHETMPKLLTELEEMITKEESILIPTSMDLLEHEEWAAIYREENEFGFAWIERGAEWNPRIKISLPTENNDSINGIEDSHEVVRVPELTQTDGSDKLIDLNVGRMSVEQVNLMLLHLPVELSFVDETDTVLYYSGVPDKIFPRTPGAIGRKVQNCHPPKSLHLVNRILSEMKAGTRDTAEFWMENFMGKFLNIRYDAVRDKNGEYRGCLESVQDIAELRTREGSKRLLEMEDSS